MFLKRNIQEVVTLFEVEWMGTTSCEKLLEEELSDQVFHRGALVRLVKWDEENSRRLEIVCCTKSLKASFLWTKVEVSVWSEGVEYEEEEVIKILEEVMILK